MNMPQLNPTTLLGGSAAIGIIVAFWGKLKSFFQYVINLFIITIKVGPNLHDAICYYCWQNFKFLPFGIKNYDGSTQYIKKISRMQLVGFEKIGKQTVFFSKRRFPIFVSLQNEDNKNNSPANTTCISISFIRGTFDSDKFIINVLDYYNENTKIGRKRFRIENIFGMGERRHSDRGYGEVNASKPTAFEQDIRFSRPLKWKLEDLGQDVIVFESALEVLAFPKEVEELITDLKRWKESERWYKEKGIPWRRGWLLYGPPGTGKTSLIRALGYDLDLPIFVFDLATLGNEELTERWKRTLNEVPCIILLEDVDAIFEGRENKANADLTFDCLLNCISGVNGSDGALLFITTNKIEKLDASLGIPTEKDSNISTRPGRIDRVLKLDILNEDCRRKLASRILKDCAHLIDKIIKDGKGDTGAQFQERCTQIALNEFWKDK